MELILAIEYCTNRSASPRPRTRTPAEQNSRRSNTSLRGRQDPPTTNVSPSMTTNSPNIPRDTDHFSPVSSSASFGHNDGDDDLAETERLLDADDANAVPARTFKQRREVYLRGKKILLEHLFKDLDLIIYCELCAVYYMDCSIVLLALRGLIQLGLFTSQMSILNALQLFEGPFVSFLLLGSNFLCMGLHCFLNGPSVSDPLSRGYIHGGILIDFVGMKAPISKIPLLAFDALVLLFQVMMLSTTMEKLRVREAQSSGGYMRQLNPDRWRENVEEQTLDREERGIINPQRDRPTSPSFPPLDRHPTPLSPLLSSSEPPLSAAAQQPLPSPSTSRSPDAAYEYDPERIYYMNEHQHPAEAFYSGEHVVLNINLLRAIRDQRLSMRPPTNQLPPASSLSPEARLLLAAAAATRADIERGRTRQGSVTRNDTTG